MLTDKIKEYLQYDPQWAKVPYQVKGETTDIRQSGCGPTCAAMVLATFVDPNITPVDTCKWSVEHGYKALKQGTYYSYFKPQFEAYGIKAEQVNSASLYHNTTSVWHNYAKSALERGDLVIACMGPGRWTTGGHFVLLYGWDDGLVYIMDPASQAKNRRYGEERVFKNEVKYYFRIDGNDLRRKEDEPMYNTIEEMPDWGKAAVQAALAEGLIEGTGQGLAISETLLKCLVVMYRAKVF